MLQQAHTRPDGPSDHHTILHFCYNRTVLVFRAWVLNSAGYHVLNVSNGFEAIRLATWKLVDAMLLDLDRNHADVELIARRVKNQRPQVPIVLLAEQKAPLHGLSEVVDVVAHRDDHPETLVKSLAEILAGGSKPSRELRA